MNNPKECLQLCRPLFVALLLFNQGFICTFIYLSVCLSDLLTRTSKVFFDGGKMRSFNGLRGVKWGGFKLWGMHLFTLTPLDVYAYLHLFPKKKLLLTVNCLKFIALFVFAYISTLCRKQTHTCKDQ